MLTETISQWDMTAFSTVHCNANSMNLCNEDMKIFEDILFLTCIILSCTDNAVLDFNITKSTDTSWSVLTDLLYIQLHIFS